MESGGRPPFDFNFGRPESNKRSYSQMEAAYRQSASPLFVRQDSIPSDDNPSPPPPPPAAAAPPRLTLPPLPPHRPHDGLDFRRPVTTMNPQNTSTSDDVIDLTSEDDSAPSVYASPQAEPPPPPARLPRYNREIIDLSVDTSPLQPQPQPQARPFGQPPPTRIMSSPEVEFVSSRPLSRVDQHPQHQLPPFLNPEPQRPVMDLTLDNDDDEVIAVGSRNGVNLLGPRGIQPRQGRMGALAQMVIEAGREHLRQTFDLGGPHLPFWGAEEDVGPQMMTRLRGLAGMPMPRFMNYETVAFDYGHGEETPRLPTPKYDPPPAAPEGFTRDPKEDDTIVCPNCEDELAVGESEEKRQVWVVKSCGHVYCGSCIHNRKVKKAKSTKGKGRAQDPEMLQPQPFSYCRADNCGHTRVSHKQDVMQIFL